MTSEFEVVVSGISGRFPQCDDIYTFKQKLYNSDDFMSDKTRWPDNYNYKIGQYSIPRFTGMYSDLIEYDSRLFKLNSFFGRSHDIINRKVLEPSFEAIVDAGINPYSLDGSNTGVFMSCGLIDVEANAFHDNRNLSLLIGGNKTMFSNRISFALNLTGPSFAYHSDIFGSVQALHAGFKNIADGLIEAAIVGVSSNIIDPKISLQFLFCDWLSMDGICRAFDESANGYGRSESTVVFFLQRAEDAKRIYGTILFSDTYYMGLKSSTFLGQNELILKNSLESIYQRHNSSNLLSKLAFMEMNAFGIKKFEMIETNVIAELICKTRNNPLLIGSIKSNVGHTEGAAAMMSILKALLALDSGVIPPNAHFSVKNRDIKAFKDNSIQVVEKAINLPGNIVGVNSIGIGGIVSHTVLKQNPLISKTNNNDEIKPSRLLLICGRTEEGLMKKIKEIETLPFNLDFISLTNDAFRSYMPLHMYRGYTILPKQFKSHHAVEERGDINRPIWFVFSGMGSQWNEMGKGLLDIPVFSDVIRRCNAALKPKGIDLYRILLSDDSTLFDDIVHSFVGIISIQIGLFEILKTIGIKPDSIIGHSVGENACAYADNCLTLEQAVLCSYERGMASTDAKTIKGMMAAVGKGYTQIKDTLPEDIAVACHNSAESCTLSGPAEKISIFVKQLTNDGIFARSVNVANIAYHSKYIAPAAPQLLSRLKKVIQHPKERSSKWISSSIPESEWKQPLAKYCSAEYLTNNLLQPVLFEEGSKFIPENAIVIEIAPHGLLQAILKRSLPETCTNISLTSRMKTKENVLFLLNSIGKLYVAGCEPNINELFPKISYPVPRGTPSISQYCTWYHEEPDVHERNIFSPTEDIKTSDIWYPVQINRDAEFSYLQFHRIGSQIIIPPSLFMYLTWCVFSNKRNEQLGSSSIIFENIKFYENVVVSVKSPKYMSVMIQESGNFEVLIKNTNTSNKLFLISSGKITALEDNADIKLDKEFDPLVQTTVNQQQFYHAYEKAGYYFSDVFATVQQLSFNDNEGIGKISWNDDWVTFLDSVMKFQMYWDIQNETNFLYPYSIRKLTICCPQFTSIEKGTAVMCHNDLETKRFRCDGLEMYGLIHRIFPSSSLSNDFSNKLQEMEFVSYTNPRRKNIQEFFELSLFLVIQNLSPILKFENAKLYIVQYITDYIRVMQTVVNENKYLKSKVSLLNEKVIADKEMRKKDGCVLLVTKNVDDIHQFDVENIFVLIAISSLKTIESLKSVVEITKQSFDGVTLYLLKKKTIQKSNYFTRVDQIKSTGENEFEFSEPEFIIRNQTETSDLTVMLSDQKTNYNKRYLFIMDDDEKEIKNEKQLIQSQLEKDLAVAVLKDGELGNYEKVSNCVISEETPFLREIPPAGAQLHSIRTCFICPEFRKNKLKYNIEYSGTDDSGKRMMGLTAINSSEPISEIDPFLLWQIPKDWTLADAATVPFIYAQAYYILRLTHGIRSSSSALINIGKEVLLTEACIRLFLSRNYSIFVTVSNDREASNIKNKFPMLEDFRILFKEKCQYERQLLRLTKKEGVSVVINGFTGIEHVTASLNCAGTLSYYIEIQEDNFRDIHRIGMFPFNRSVSFFSMPSKISFLLRIPTEDKILLQKDVESGINSGLVTPFPKILLADESMENYRREIPGFKKVVQCFPASKVKETKNYKPRYDNNRSYIIVGESRRNQWMELVEWLIEKGARKFIVVFDSFFISARLSYQINKLLSKEKIIISFTLSNKLNSIQEASNLIAEANAVESLEAIFFVSVESAGKKIRNLDLATQLYDPENFVYFLSIFSGGLKELESRHRKGFPAIVLHGKQCTKKLSWILSDVNQLLSRRDPNNSSVLYKVIDENLRSETAAFSTLIEYLPKTLKHLEKLGNHVIDIPTFKEKASLCPSYSEIRGVYPIFVIPGLHGDLLNPILKKLIYPVYCTGLPEKLFSTLETASTLYQNMCKIQPSGPITIIGETWNTALIIELSLLIKIAGREYKIFLLEGNTSEWEERLKSLGDANSPFFENNLIKQIFHFSQELSDTELTSSISFQDKINYCLSKINSNNVNLNHVIKAANALRNRLLSILQYKPGDNLLCNTTLFLRHATNYSFHNLSVTSDFIIIEADGYENFLKNAEISRTINENSAFSWWD